MHAEDGGRIHQKRICEVCHAEVSYADIAKGYTASHGRVAVLTKDDLAELPFESEKAVSVQQFVDPAEIDPTYFDKTYVLEAEQVGAKPYVLLRDAMAKSGKAAIVKVALRSRETLALIRPHEEALVMHTMLWPDEIRDVEFATPSADVKLSDAEIGMAEMFIEQMTEPFDPDKYTDWYREAVEGLVAAKLDGAPVPQASDDDGEGAQVVDLVAALKASVAAAKKRRAAQETPAEPEKKTRRKAG